MSWRSRLVWANEDDKQRKKASFRGAEFSISDVDRSVGRRNIVHKYPFKDDSYIEDIGRDTDEFTINGFIVQQKNSAGDYDYIDERDALIEALRSSGPGTLIHPFYGQLQVSLVGKARISESFSEGGIARFTMTFVKISDEQATSEGLDISPYPKTVTDYQQSVDSAAENSVKMAQDGFGNVYSSDFFSTTTQDSIMNSVDTLNLMLKGVISSVQSAFPSQVSKALGYLAETKAGIDITKIQDTCEFAASIVGMMNGLKSIAGLYGEILSDELFGACSDLVYGNYTGPFSSTRNPLNSSSQSTGFASASIENPSYIGESLGKTSVRALLEINGFGEVSGSNNESVYGGTLPYLSIITDQKARQSANLIAIVNLSRVSALSAAAQAAVSINYGSYDSAIEIMDEVISAFDAFLLKLGNDSEDTNYDTYNITVSDPDSYNAIESLRPIFVEAMKGIGATLPIPIDYEVPPTVISTLTLAYDTYYDLDRESDIIDRNLPLIKNPCFLPEGQTIQLLEP